MHNFHVSLSAHISSLVEFDCKVISNIFGSMLAEKGYSRELISVSIVPVESDSKYEQKRLQERSTTLHSCSYWFSYR